ncbi:glycosyltransferase family 4 protein [Sphingobacterium sp. SGG-5]|uniref:glycosyltransferase n=1 Tax=Sphingobacterium sp. SGG-5 TaxID=2710881 RepID=UPI0013ECAD7E|nr:glycosyltransferase [Sphingobacterium sp. SGG-5]NGM61165.1 glycosyltransferase family 4 protein [Sphingobacterium sp. SGG-5]
MKKALFIGLVWPEPQSSAAGWRMLQLIELFQRQYDVHFASAAAKSDFSHDLQTMGVTEHTILLNDSSFDDFVQELQPDIVVFDRFMIEEQYGWRVAKCCPNAIRVLDTEDLHFLRLARQEAFRKNQPLDLYHDTTFREIAAIYRSDLALIISEKEMEILTETFHVPSDLLYFLPFIEKAITDDHIQQLPTYEQRKDFVFIGNFLHEPNWRTVEALKRTIWPALRRELPNAALHIYGSYASEKVNQLHAPQDRFLIQGRAGHARKTLEQYRVLLAPIPVGAGIKGKFVDAMYSGTPSVSSSVGAEGMIKEGLWNGYVVDQGEEFVKQAKILYTDRTIWEDAQQRGVKLFNTSFAQSLYADRLLQCCDDLQKELPAHRVANFIGQMLRHHTVQSTRYMSLWIAEKNKRAH